MRIIEYLNGVEIEKVVDVPLSGTITKRLEIPKLVMIKLQAGIVADERVEVQDDFTEEITYIFAPEMAVNGGICPGPCLGPVLVVDGFGCRLMIELDRAELEMLETIDLTNIP